MTGRGFLLVLFTILILAGLSWVGSHNQQLPKIIYGKVLGP